MMNEMNKRQSDKKDQKPQHIEKNKLEWFVFGCSMVLVLFIVGYLVYQGFQPNIATPQLSLKSKPDPTKNDKYRWHITVSNSGSETAEDVRVEAISLQANATQEKSELMISFVPKGSSREGWIIFSQPPACDTCMQVRITSYKRP